MSIIETIRTKQPQVIDAAKSISKVVYFDFVFWGRDGVKYNADIPHYWLDESGEEPKKVYLNLFKNTSIMDFATVDYLATVVSSQATNYSDRETELLRAGFLAKMGTNGYWNLTASGYEFV